MKTEIPTHTVTSFVSSKEKRQLTTRRALFHIIDRIKWYYNGPRNLDKYIRWKTVV